MSIGCKGFTASILLTVSIGEYMDWSSGIVKVIQSVHLRGEWATAALPDGFQLLPLQLQGGSQSFSSYVAPLLNEPLSCCFPLSLRP